MARDSFLARNAAGNSGFAAVLMLFFGFYRWGSYGTSESALYNFSVPLLTWTLLVGGALLGAASLLSMRGMHGALALDAAVSALCGVIFLFVGLLWTWHDGLGFNSLLILFGVMYLRAARETWSFFRAPAEAVDAIPVATPVAPPPAAVPDPALPAPHEPPPPDGYLAALGRAKRDRAQDAGPGR